MTVRDATLAPGQESDTYFHSIVQSMPDSVIVIDAAGQIVSINAAAERTFGYKPKQLLGNSIDILVPSRLRASHAEHRKEFLGRPRIRQMGEQLDLFAVRADGSEFPVTVSLGYFQDDDRMLVIATVHDMTEMRARDRFIAELNERLSRDNAALSALNYELEAFSYSVSHDLRAPLRTVDGFSHILEHASASKLDEQGIDCIRRIRAAAQRMAELIDDMLKLSKISSSELVRSDVDLSAIAREVVDTLRAGAPDRTLEFNIVDGIHGNGDAGLLRIALENMLGNAVKFTGGVASARIEFGQQTVDGKTAYYIRDNGAGFDMAHAKRLFSAFNRLHDDRQFSGHGIGLATVLRIINKHAGRIWAEAKRGEGACFYFTL